LTPSLRIAVPIVSSRAWQGGFNYQLNLVRSLAAHVADRIQPVAFFGEDADDGDVAAFAANAGVEVVRDAAFSHSGQGARLMRALLLGLDKDAAAVFTARGIDAVFESARFFGWRLPQAAIAWFPDFQHRRLPELFSRLAWWRRDIGFRMQLGHGRTILLSSEDARRDCESYYPQSKGRIRVLRFPAMVEPKDLAADPVAVRAQYGIPDRFIYLPNQFWRHKNHAVVVEALGILRQRCIVASVVATGNKSDPRDPALFDDLSSRLETLGASTMFRALGVVPRPHVIALMRTCTAFLNPSVCEGWSSGVEEAKLFGVPMILSELAVHREQAGPNAKYFATDDPGTLADMLADALSSQGGTISPRSPRGDAGENAKVYAEAFAGIVRETCQAWRA
jgi:glycosyltransferase involved in cell wall biosynthesis